MSWIVQTQTQQHILFLLVLIVYLFGGLLIQKKHVFEKNESGKVLLIPCYYTRHRFHEHLESVTCLAWGKGTGASLLASGDQDGRMFIYNCGSSSFLQGNAAIAVNSDALKHKPGLLGTLIGHSDKVITLKWCVNEF